jgi:hypothetical protein
MKILQGLCVAVIFVLGSGCASGPAGDSATSQAPSPVRPGIIIPGFEALGSPEARRKADVIARFGPAASEESLGGGQYTILAYSVNGWEEPLLILFHGEELLGFARGSARAALESTVQHHARSAGDRVVVFQSWVDGKTTYFMATRDQLEQVPKWTAGSGTPPPLSEPDALRLGAEWANQAGIETPAPAVARLEQVRSVPGAAFYIVTLLTGQSTRNLVVLMDGTVLAGESEQP